jgi:type I restriction enzyme M protein
LVEWWGQREKSDVAWLVKVEDLKRGFDLDVKNPNSTVEENDHTVEGLLHLLAKRQMKISDLVAKLESSLIAN